MKLKTKELKSALLELGRLIKPKQFVPQLSHMQFTSNGSSLSPTLVMQACDGESWAARLLECDEVVEGCLGHKQLLALIENTDAEFTDIKVSAGWATIRTHATCRIPALEAGVYPDFPAQQIKPLALPLIDLAEGIESVVWAAEDNELLSTRLINVYVVSTGKQLSVYAGSKYSIARFRRALLGEVVSLGIPANAARLISKVLREPNSTLSLGERFLIAKSESGSAAVKLTTERMSDYDAAIGLHEHGQPSPFERDLIKQACTHAMALTDDANYPSLEICWEMRSLRFQSGDKEGKGYEYETNGPEGSGWCKLNAKHLHEAMRLMPEGPLTATTAPNGSFWMVGDVLVALGQLGTRKT